MTCISHIAALSLDLSILYLVPVQFESLKIVVFILGNNYKVLDCHLVFDMNKCKLELILLLCITSRNLDLLECSSGDIMARMSLF